MKITYIWHDCFWIETEACHVIFDFWKDIEGTTPRLLNMLDPDKPIYIFVSHHHKDHFTPEIYGWSHRFPKIHYIISKDTFKASRHYIKEDSMYRGDYRVKPEQVTMLPRGESYKDELIEAYAFGSTDIGNSYMVKVAGKRIFHAGDLNAWVWKDESTKAEIAAAIRDYKRILDDIKVVTDSFDYAMFPVDARIGRDYWEGAKIFVHEFKVEHFIPMHFTLGKDLDQQIYFTNCATDFDAYRNTEYGEYIALTVPYSYTQL